MRWKVVKISIIFFAGFALRGQEGIPYLDFGLYSSGDNVVVTWTVKAGNTCQDVEIWRGSDSLNLEEVFVYAGICGDNDSDKSYSYIDKAPVAGVLYYYRIEIVTDRTEVKSVLLLPSQGIEVYPNPANDILNIIHNPQSGLKSVRIIDHTGKEVLKLQNPDAAESINLSGLPGNIYYIEADFGKDKLYRRLLIN